MGWQGDVAYELQTYLALYLTCPAPFGYCLLQIRTSHLWVYLDRLGWRNSDMKKTKVPHIMIWTSIISMTHLCFSTYACQFIVWFRIYHVIYLWKHILYKSESPSKLDNGSWSWSFNTSSSSSHIPPFLNVHIFIIMVKYFMNIFELEEHACFWDTNVQECFLVRDSISICTINWHFQPCFIK